MASDEKHHGHGHGRRFDFDKAHKLDNEDRQRLQPAEPLVNALGLKGHEVVVDLGAGTGYFTFAIARKLTKGKVAAVDIEPRMLERIDARAKELKLDDRVERITVSEANPSALPIPDDTVDRLLMVNLLHELDDPGAALAEVKRVLTRGGQVWVVDWDPNGTTEFGPPRDHRIPVEAAERALQEAGFEGVRRVDLYPNHYTVTGQRF